MIDNPYKILIGIAGPIGSGKSTLAACLASGKNSVILPFAQPIKTLAKQMGWNGKKDAKGRRLLQLLGTECGRECIDPDIWVSKWKASVREAWSLGAVIVVADDMRFENEAETVKELGGILLHVTGRGESCSREKCCHKSEASLPSGLFDITYRNMGSVNDMRYFASNLIRNRLQQISEDCDDSDAVAEVLAERGLA